MASQTVVSLPSVPLITIFVRHSEDCPHSAKGFYKKCKCRKSLRYFHGGKQRTVSAKTRSWEQAEEVKRELEERFRAADGAEPIEDVSVQAAERTTIERAVELFVKDKRTQGLGVAVIGKYERELERFAEAMGRRSRLFPADVTMEDLTEFRAGWSKAYPSSTTRAKVQERLRAFLRYC